jgi:hypothetical protein
MPESREDHKALPNGGGRLNALSARIFSLSHRRVAIVSAV